MPQQQTCPVCAGNRGTEKVEHTVEIDSNGNQVPKVNRSWSPCSMCGGSGLVVVG
jgi:DnaJ-class molecular chaperone